MKYLFEDIDVRFSVNVVIARGKNEAVIENPSGASKNKQGTIGRATVK